MKKIIDLESRKHTKFTSTVSGELGGEVNILGNKLTSLATNKSFAYIVGSAWLGRELKSKKTEEFINLVLKLLVDHGPYVSGAVNTIISARAGKDLVSSLASGLLTIGSRFGGAINGAAETFYTATLQKTKPKELVENFAKQKKYIPGIGHRKYRTDLPDPRVTLIKKFGEQLAKRTHIKYALEIEKITTNKKANLILNVDGAIAATMLDLLVEEEKLTTSQLEQLIKSEFFNAIFVLSRSVGFIAHFLDQKRLNEPLFRLEPVDVFILTK
jgi:citrate synthase